MCSQGTLVHLALLLTIGALASADSSLHPQPPAADVKLVSSDAQSYKSLQAVYISGDLSFNVTSKVEVTAPPTWSEPGSTSYIVSTISVTRLGEDEHAQTLSQLVIPGKYLYERKIPDMEERMIHSAKDMLEVTNSLRGPQLSDLVRCYDAIIRDLIERIDLQHKFNQGHASIIYHASIAKTAQRLAGGAAPERACPAHPAYQHKGLFACQQEYNIHARRVQASPFFKCKDSACVENLQKSLSGFVKRESQVVSLGQAVERVEDVLSLGNNPELAEEVARLIACGDIDCKEPGCSSWLHTEGWFIFGADWGCCGDYPGCCYLATETCLVHDAICTCCSFPDFCLDPFCKPDPWCSNMTTTAAP